MNPLITVTAILDQRSAYSLVDRLHIISDVLNFVGINYGMSISAQSSVIDEHGRQVIVHLQGYLVVDEEPFAVVPLVIDLVNDYPHRGPMVRIALNDDSHIVHPHPNLQRPSSFVKDVDHVVHWEYPNSNLCELVDVLKNLFRSQTPILRKLEYCHCSAIFTDACSLCLFYCFNSQLQ
ncbi:hypothetical protein Pyn_20903 [Prunus yedoensis var. nudiflora]|uniref:UEV domain-containing protein n=1 Tax=Prunus yedoensis var. nudiflora TaxID=2094558 RepID=A0A314YQX8_PRUYE|nr:hypothetical protein Pyn_20903 [Prunus yedoensis var. nudiflora]